MLHARAVLRDYLGRPKVERLLARILVCTLGGQFEKGRYTACGGRSVLRSILASGRVTYSADGLRQRFVDKEPSVLVNNNNGLLVGDLTGPQLIRPPSCLPRLLVPPAPAFPALTTLLWSVG